MLTFGLVNKPKGNENPATQWYREKMTNNVSSYHMLIKVATLLGTLTLVGLAYFLLMCIVCLYLFVIYFCVNLG